MKKTRSVKLTKADEKLMTKILKRLCPLCDGDGFLPVKSARTWREILDDAKRMKSEMTDDAKRISRLSPGR